MDSKKKIKFISLYYAIGPIGFWNYTQSNALQLKGSGNFAIGEMVFMSHDRPNLNGGTDVYGGIVVDGSDNGNEFFSILENAKKF